MAKFLDSTGLTTLWGKIKDLVNGKAATVAPKDGASAAAIGTSDKYAREDHVHKLPTPAQIGAAATAALTNGSVTKVGTTDVGTATKPMYLKAGVPTACTTDMSTLAPKASPTLTGTPKAPTAAAGTNTTQIATTAFVESAVNSKIAAANALIYKGTVSSKSALPTSGVQVGWTYIASEDGTYGGHKCEKGDMLIVTDDGMEPGGSMDVITWDCIQGNTDGHVTGPATAVSTHVATFDGATGKLIKDSGFTIGANVPSGAKFTDTTYSAATTSAAGLMSAADKTKLDGIDTLKESDITAVCV